MNPALNAATNSAATNAAVQQAIANSIRASGVLVRMEPGDLLGLLGRTAEPLVVYAIQSGFLQKTKHQYLTSYKGLAFFAHSDEPIQLPREAEVVTADKIGIPG
ncbi:hypothetical protein Mal64_38980 [Pseudobythopirellula maris]|uniref:Uncharacterized protein n=1 Tax=Pseudobythopirellula maris TaxID=2527991 RepID=A0A5C5ZG91_9BACT|nr:hypothetical protein [Pseudobythopirellula maris]TWT86158.1 hypothetical protein Mal64_38980 [Pseudobythopirellula maris]